MSESGKRVQDDAFEALLRKSLAGAPPPELPPSFTERITARLRPRRLDASAKRTLLLYTLTAIALSLGVMASLGAPWPLIAVALAVPAALGLLLRWRLR